MLNPRTPVKSAALTQIKRRQPDRVQYLAGSADNVRFANHPVSQITISLVQSGIAGAQHCVLRAGNISLLFDAAASI
jgi:hypothetical protein